jgi:hypothetical protein
MTFVAVLFIASLVAYIIVTLKSSDEDNELGFHSEPKVTTPVTEDRFERRDARWKAELDEMYERKAQRHIEKTRMAVPGDRRSPSSDYSADCSASVPSLDLPSFDTDDTPNRCNDSGNHCVPTVDTSSSSYDSSSSSSSYDSSSSSSSYDSSSSSSFDSSSY